MIKEDLEQEKFNKELEDKLKVTYPEFENKCDEVYSKCVDGCKKRSNAKLISLICSFACFLILIVFIGLTINDRKSDDVIKIENKINDLSKIKNDEEKLMNIMYLECSISELSIDDSNIISNINILNSEKKQTSEKLKEKVAWCEYLNKDVDYCKLYDLYDLNSITEIILVKNFSSIRDNIIDLETIKKLFEILDVPYCDIINYDDINSVSYLLHSEIPIEEFECYMFSVNKNNEILNFHIYSNGYISLSTKINNIEKNYVSLVKIDFENIKELCSYNFSILK